MTEWSDINETYAKYAETGGCFEICPSLRGDHNPWTDQTKILGQAAS